MNGIIIFGTIMGFVATGALVAIAAGIFMIVDEMIDRRDK